MKLQQFLKENEYQIDFEYLEKFREEVAEAIVYAENELKSKGFKISEITSDPDDSDLEVVFTNKILDVMFSVRLTPGSDPGSENLNLDIQLSIADAYTVGGGLTKPSAINTYRSDTIKPREEQKFVDYCKEAIADILKLVDDFHNWYLDITGEYGKVKMYVDYKNGHKIVAIAGEFDVANKKHEVF